MKTNKLLLLTAAACLGLSSCSDDDSNNNNNNDQAGVYNLTSIIVPEEIDFDMNETFSNDLLDESQCYLNTKIELNDDMTYTAEYNYVLITGEEEQCVSEETFGTWERDGEMITLTDETEGNQENFQMIEYTFDEENNTLTLVKTNMPYPDRDDQDNPVYSSGDVILTYTKEDTE